MRALGRYRPIGLLGEGGMASVYLAVQDTGRGTQRLAVVKVVKSTLSGDEQYREMFAQESGLAMRLAHPNVVHGYEVGEHDGCPYLAMEYLDGQSLLGLLRRVGRKSLPLDVHVQILVEVLKALDYAHQLKDYDGTPLNLVHRDVTPGNVFVTYEGNVKLVDFGIAKSSLAEIRTETGVLKGKVAYMAPEQATAGEVGPFSDVFAVGIMLWEALAGRTLGRKGDDANALLFRRIDKGDPSIREAAPDAPEGLAAVCDRATQRSIGLRYAQAADMQQDLEEWLRGRDAGGTSHQRDLGRLVSEAFTKERATLASRIDDAMTRRRHTDSVSLVVPSLKLSGEQSIEPSAPSLARTVDPSMPPPKDSTPNRKRSITAFMIGLATVAIVAGSGFAVQRMRATEPPPMPAEPLASDAGNVTVVAETIPSASATVPTSPTPSESAKLGPAPPRHFPPVRPSPPPAGEPPTKPARVPKPIDKEDPY